MGNSFQLRFDMRAPTFGAPRADLYRAAIDMTEFGDRHDFKAVMLSEHHGVDDGYLPSAITLASAMAARTKQLRLVLSALIVPLYDPLHLAEELAVLDIISGGRVTVVVAGGYVESEFEMFGRDLRQRAAAVEETVRVLRAAWTGQPFQYQGRTVCITPRPLQEALPIVMGGSVPAAAKRAGRIADGFLTHLPDLHEIYAAEATAHGKQPSAFVQPGPGCVFVSENPEATWEKLMPHALHETNAYGAWQKKANTSGSYEVMTSPEALRASGMYAVVTPDECLQMARTSENVFMHPLVGGMDPAVGWNSLKLVKEKVLPRL